MTTRRTLPAALLSVALLASAVGCSGGDSGTADAGGSVAAQEVPQSASRANAYEAGGDLDSLSNRVADTAQAKGAGKQAVSATSFLGRDVIATAQVRVRTEDVGEARDRVRDVLTRYVGYVAEERTERDRDGETVTSVMRLRVPTTKFDQALLAFEDLAPAVDIDRQTEDVTQQVVDVASRIRTQEVSLGRLRGFLDGATDLDGIVRLEAEIARREGDLASLRAQQRELRDLTAESTITVRLDRIAAAKQKRPETDESGFVAGLSTGWDAFTTTVTGLAQAAGVVLPFAVVLVLLGGPLLVWLRRRRVVVSTSSTSTV